MELVDVPSTHLSPHVATFVMFLVVWLLQPLAAYAELVPPLPGPRHARRRSCLALAFGLSSLCLIAVAHKRFGVALAVQVVHALALRQAYIDSAGCGLKASPLAVRALVSISMAWACYCLCLCALAACARESLSTERAAVLKLEEARAVGPISVVERLSCAAVFSLTVLALAVVATRCDWRFAGTMAVILVGVRGAQATQGSVAVASAAGKGIAACSLGCALAARHCTGRRARSQRPEEQVLVRSDSFVEDSFV